MSILGFVGEIYFEDKVVVHYKNGRIVKGHTSDFDPSRDAFTVQPYADGHQEVNVDLEELKAVFHVKTFEGNPEHGPSPEGIGEIPDPRWRDIMARGHKALLEFNDGERMWGFAAGVDKPMPGFFFFPTDPESNNLRLYVVRSALRNMVSLDG